MDLSLLAPLFLLALVALAVPILVHLTARDRRDAVRFPSLRFLTRLPYRQTRRQRLRHPLLFALRALAIALLAVAFARPLADGVGLTVLGGEREVVIAVDRSYSMGYGDTWERAVAAAREAVDAQPQGSRVSLLTFAEEARIAVAPTTDRPAVTAVLDALAPSAGGTRLGPALELADEVLLESPAGDRQVVMISDFQAFAWDRSTAVRLAAGTELTTVDLAAEQPANVTIADVAVRWQSTAGGRRVVLNPRLVHRGPEAVRDLPVTVEVDGTEMATAAVDLVPSGVETVRLGPIEPPATVARVSVRIGGDLLAPDNVFHLTLSPRPALPVLLIRADDDRDSESLYLRQALTAAHLEVVSRSASRVRAADVEAASVVILDDSPLPAGAAGRALVDRVAAGGGLWVILGRRGGDWPAAAAALLPARWRQATDRLDVRGVTLAGVDDDHPVFEIFAGPDAGNLAAARFYRYRPLVLAEGAAAVARYSDGNLALAEKSFGDGRVLVWGSTFDNRWSNLPVEPVFLPFVHRVCRFLGGERIDLGQRVGGLLDLRQLAAGADSEPAAGRVVVTPSGLRREVDPQEEPWVRLEEAGFYQVAAQPVAVNVDRAESDLSTLDVEAFVAASTVPASSSPADHGVQGLTRDQRERRQGVWWYLVLGALGVLVGESVVSNRTKRL